MLVAMPMIAGAAPVAGEPVAGNADSPTATNAPKYALKQADGDDGKAATAGYVKGAYNAVIKGINNTQDEINTLNTGIETYSDAIGHLTDGKATQDGTVATIKSAKTNESIATSSVQFNNVTTTSISATASGNVNLSVPRMADWETDSLAETPVQTTASFSGLAVDNLTMSAPGTNNTATLTKTGISGNVDVVKYVTQAINAGTFDFTTLIDVNGDGYAGANGEWTTTWNDYGTVKGTSMCSSTPGSFAETGNPPNDKGAFCWCKMTAWTPNGGTETPAASLWVYFGMGGSPANCDCASGCGNLVRSNASFRSGIFSNVQ